MKSGRTVHPRSLGGSEGFTIADYEEARNKYRPKRIMLLFVAESPPSSGGFFYFAKTIGKDHLFRETMKALKLWPTSRPMVKGVDKRPMLEEFQTRGFFLVDTSPLPVDKLSREERGASVAFNAISVARRTRDLNPVAVVIVKKTVFRPVRNAFKEFGLEHKLLNKSPLPFPSHGNQRTYRLQLQRLIKNIET